MKRRVNLLGESRAARARIAGHVRLTPFVAAPEWDGPTGGHVFLKLENQQVTGSFKVRGALNKLLALSPEARKRGVVAASSGNHGAGVAQGLRWLGAPGLIFVPENATPSKVDAIRRLGAEVVTSGATCEAAEAAAREFASQRGRPFISPYNDPDVVAGQGTIGLEMAEQSPVPLDAVFVAVGSGGLAAGIAGVLKALRPGIAVYGCSPENDCAMAASVRAGRIVEVAAKPTISDGTAGGIEPGSITFALCRDLVDDFVLVSESEIREALRGLVGRSRQLVEGAAAAALAGALKSRPRTAGKNVGVVLCGANIGVETLKSAL